MSEKHQINLILGARKILSVNSLYNAKMIFRGGKSFATIYKSAEAKKTEEYIKEQVRTLDIANNYPWVTKDTLFKMTIQVIFKSGFLLRDLDNTLKLVQDGIFRALDLNDSHVVEIIANKKLFPGISEEKIFVCLEERRKDDIRFDYIPRPNIIWTEYDIRNLPEFKTLPKKGVKKEILYITPEEKDKADTKLYVLEPKTFNYNTTLKIFSDLTENILDSKGFGYIVVLGDSNSWGDKWSDLIEFMNIINDITKNSYSGIKIKQLSDIKDTYNWLKNE